MPRTAGDLMLAAVLALLSYAPFEYVAKTTLIIAAGLFIIDPIPPYSRLIALLSVGMVGLLSRVLRTWQEGQQEEEHEEGDGLAPTQQQQQQQLKASGKTESKKQI
uniref:Uncharacterized protein n=1 Tax=Amphora coffeiformis TaxID=265554 RepID=A0A7S3P4Y8_9STRA|mmetsp:Transcript_19041/g.36101  ORF Transcript_19041/g.36101 Transcript_19041/m.36101 type:complete len:106 (+) Transcript_19041:118-435(+)